MNEQMKRAVYEWLMDQLEDAIARRDGDQVGTVLRFMAAIDPETTDRFVRGLLEIGFRRMAGLID